MSDISNDDLQFQTSSIRWAYEMELVDNPILLNNLYLNIYAKSRYIKDVELMIDSNLRQILIFIELKWFSKIFKKTQRNIANRILDEINYLLPRFKVRVTTKRMIFEKSKKLVYKKLYGDGSSFYKSQIKSKEIG